MRPVVRHGTVPALRSGHGRHQAVGVRPGATGLLIGIECSRVRDSSWMYLTSLVTTRIGVVLAVVHGNYPIML